MTVFISYSRKDLEFVQKLAGDLEQASYKVWWDQTGLQAGEDWVRSIPNAILSSNYFIVVITSDSIASDWVEKEITQALQADRRIIPIRRDPSDVPFQLITLNPIDFQKNEDYTAKFNNLLAAMGYQGDPPVVTSFKPKPPLPGPLRWFIISGIAILFIGIVGIVFTLIWNTHPNQPPVPTATDTRPATLVPNSIPGVVPARIIVTYGDGNKTSYDCPTSTLPAALGDQEKVSLELSAAVPDVTLEKLEWVSFVSGSKATFGIGKTATYSPTEEGILYVTLGGAIICTLNLR